MNTTYENDEELVECVGVAFNHADALRYVQEFREQYVKAERERVLEDLEDWAETWGEAHVSEGIAEFVARQRDVK